MKEAWAAMKETVGSWRARVLSRRSSWDALYFPRSPWSLGLSLLTGPTHSIPPSSPARGPPSLCLGCLCQPVLDSRAGVMILTAWKRSQSWQEVANKSKNICLVVLFYR